MLWSLTFVGSFLRCRSRSNESPEQTASDLTRRLIFTILSISAPRWISLRASGGVLYLWPKLALVPWDGGDEGMKRSQIVATFGTSTTGPLRPSPCTPL